MARALRVLALSVMIIARSLALDVDFAASCERLLGGNPVLCAALAAKIDATTAADLGISADCASDLLSFVSRTDTTAQLARYASAPLPLLAETVLGLVISAVNGTSEASTEDVVAEFGTFLALHGTSLGDRGACASLDGYTYFVVARQDAFAPAFGLCLPSSCSVRDIHRLAVEVLPSVRVRDDRYRLKLDAVGHVMVAVCFVLAALAVLATGVDLLSERLQTTTPRRTTSRQSRISTDAADATASSSFWDEQQHTSYSPLHDDEEFKAEHRGPPPSNTKAPAPRPPRTQTSCLSAALRCFSLAVSCDEWQQRRGGSLACLDGLRVLSMLWVIFGHTAIWPIFAPSFANFEAIVPIEGSKTTSFFEKWEGQILPSAEFAVDTFFWLSGFLATHIVLKKKHVVLTSPARLVKFVPVAFLQRYLRLTPTYAFVFFMWWKVEKTFGRGAFWAQQRPQYQSCAKYWWTNFLYVNNLHPWNEPGTCYGVTWYLANDMQLFLVFVPLTVVAYQTCGPKWTLGGLAASCAASMGFAWYLADEFKLSFATFDTSDYFNDYYQRPWTRAPAYLIGVAAAIVWRHAQPSLDENGRLVVLLPKGASADVLMLLALGLGATVVFGCYPFNQDSPSTEPMWKNHLYLVFSKPAWCVAVSVIALLSFAGRGGLVATILEAGPMAPLAKLTYAGYLIHPAVLDYLFRSRETQLVTFSEIWYLVTFLGVSVIVFLAAFAVHITVESPLLRLEKLLEERLGGRGGAGRRASSSSTGSGDASSSSRSSSSSSRASLALGASFLGSSAAGPPPLLESTPSIEIA